MVICVLHLILFSRPCRSCIGCSNKKSLVLVEYLKPIAMRSTPLGTVSFKTTCTPPGAFSKAFSMYSFGYSALLFLTWSTALIPLWPRAAAAFTDPSHASPWIVWWRSSSAETHPVASQRVQAAVVPSSCWYCWLAIPAFPLCNSRKSMQPVVGHAATLNSVPNNTRKECKIVS